MIIKIWLEAFVLLAASTMFIPLCGMILDGFGAWDNFFKRLWFVCIGLVFTNTLLLAMTFIWVMFP